jgi:hypothetical protein
VNAVSKNSTGRTCERALRAGRPAIALLLLAAGCVGPGAPGRSERTWRITPLLEAGPVGEGGSRLALRPVFSRETDRHGTNAVTDFLWPLGTAHRTGERLWWRCFPAFGSDDDRLDPASRYDFSVLPIYFQGRTREGQGYRALFPLGGEVRHVAALDRARFCLFPIYAEFDRGSTHGLAWFWPLYTRREGPHVDQLALFPFYGRLHHTGGAWTGRLHFVLWPFWTDLERDGPTGRGRGFVLFPLYGRVDLDTEQTWMALPPLFRFTRGTDGYRRLHCPWPFVQIQSGKRPRWDLWPLAGWSSAGDRHRWYALWPIAGGETVRRPGAAASRLYVNPILYRERREASEATRFTFWPLAGWRRDGSNAFLRLPELNPFQGHAAVERNWAPLWSLYTLRRSAAGTENELLWGTLRWGRAAPAAPYFQLGPLFRCQRTERGVDWAVLEGLLGRQPGADRGRWSVFWWTRSSDRSGKAAAAP